jgi:hypothetical protein
MSELIRCETCGEFFNLALLSEVFEHEHAGLETDQEHFGTPVREDIL